MYRIAGTFKVHHERRDDFIAAVIEDERGSLTDEPGTRWIELIVDQDDRDRFYLDEAYTDEAAFNRHADGPHYARFFEITAGLTTEHSRLFAGTQLTETPRGPR